MFFVLLRVPQLCYNKSFSESHQHLLSGRHIIFPNVFGHISGCAGLAMAVLVLTQMIALAPCDLGPAGLISYAYSKEVSVVQGLFPPGQVSGL